MTERQTTRDQGLSPEQLSFRELFVEAANGLDIVHSVSPNPDDPFSVNIRFRGGSRGVGPFSFFLQNVFRETRGQGAAAIREKLQLTIVDLAQAGSAEFTEGVEKHLLPMLRTSTFGVEHEEAFVSRPFVPCVDMLVGIDREHTTEFVGRQRCKAWVLSEEALFEMAERGFSRRGWALERYPEEDFPILSIVTQWGSASSWLAKPGFLESVRSEIVGRPIAAIPHNDLLIVSGDGEPRAIKRTLEIARREYGARDSRSLSLGIYTLSDAGKVVPYEPPEDHPLRNEVRFAHLETRHNVVAEQRHLIAHRERRAGRDTFVASYDILHDDARDAFSVTVWPPIDNVVLPETERVVVAKRASEVGLVSWGEMMNIAGDCFTREPGSDSAWWRVTRRPNLAEFAALMRVAVVKG